MKASVHHFRPQTRHVYESVSVHVQSPFLSLRLVLVPSQHPSQSPSVYSVTAQQVPATAVEYHSTPTHSLGVEVERVLGSLRRQRRIRYE